MRYLTLLSPRSIDLPAHWRCSALCLTVSLLLAGCLSSYQHAPRTDSAPTVRVDPESITDAIPRRVLITRAGNKNPYRVKGKTYHLLPDSKGYKEKGIASWYGTKFQGRPTANGETYNLYGMTAAHRTLRIPAYVKVTNLENGRTAVVRVNDRGPFHDNRIIDLSYAAAVKLGYADKGTAMVQVETIDPGVTVAGNNDGVYFLQAAAFKSLVRANKLKTQLLAELNRDVAVKVSNPVGYYQVHIGPLRRLKDVRQVSDQLLALGLGSPYLISQ